MDSKRSTTIHLWCGPRSLSTVTMYSFAQRPDTIVLDEPLYPAYLAKYPELYRPYRNELLSKSNVDPLSVISEIQGMHAATGKLIVVKNLAKHFMDFDPALLQGDNTRHVFIVRNPMEMVLSWGVKNEIHREECSLEATCLPKMVSLFACFRECSGHPPLVLDSNLLASRPRETLEALCKNLGIPFYEEQLTWSAGPKPYDGMWAPYWYDSVHRSTGFNRRDDGSAIVRQFPKISPAQLDIYREALPFYEMLRSKAIGCSVLCTATSSLANKSLFSEDLIADPRNEDVLVWIGARLLPRESARVSVFDSSVQGGDAVWEGLRIYDGKIFKFEEHLQRLVDSAKAMAFVEIPEKEFIRQAVYQTLAANGMRHDAHIRLTLTRGVKTTSSMNPNFNKFGPTLIVLPEWKPVGDAATYDNAGGISLITACNRRNPPQCVDSKIHHNNLINNILPKIQANNAGAADALMLDTEGFVSETNATNVFLVKHGVLITPTADYCLPGITRQTIIQLAPSIDIPVEVRRVSLTEFYAADEAFTTGTMGELTPVVLIDGRSIGDGRAGPLTRKLQQEYRELTKTSGVPLPF